MESRRTIHYIGNTVEIPHPSAGNWRRRNHGIKTISITEDKPATFEEKVCATSQCVWCRLAFDDYSIRCRACGNCQYCGRFCVNVENCMLCGNTLPEELKDNSPRRVVRFE